LKDFEEQELIDGCISGDQRCYHEIFNRFKDKVFSIAYSILRSRPEAEDAVQESFIKVFKNIGSVKSATSLTSWILRIAHNTALDIRKGRRQAHSLEEMIESRNPQIRTKTKNKNPDLDYLAREMENSIVEAIDSLPQPLRQTFILGVIEKLPYKEVSQILNISETSVKMNIYRARRTLKEKLVDYLN
jgi:RNA polymerase sigma-70 factor (ECF subfamily)